MEIVAPAGDYNKFIAAVKAGADAVYLGIKGFGARRRAKNFTFEELRMAIDYAHLRGVKIYLTLNTIMKDVEIENLYENIKKVYEYGVDAIIIQDFGLLRFIRENFKEIELHASTQMTISNADEINYLKKIGISRVVPARELDYESIKKIREKTDIELEIFVSGALCISYSGNCYMSSFIGGRSGNRGMCAQPCRKEYNYKENKGYILSPKDQLFGIDEIKKLKEIGIDSIKIEGRMKSEEYVYEVVSYYRNLIDNLNKESNVEKIFNRGYSNGYFYNDKNLMNEKYASHFGYKIGEKISSNRFKLIDNVILGDGITFVDKDLNVLYGYNINRIDTINNKNLKEAKKNDIIVFRNNLFENLNKVEYIYKNYDKLVLDTINKKIKNLDKKVGINIEILAKLNKKLKIKISYKNIEIEKEYFIIEKAEKRATTKEKIIEKFNELGDTSFFIQNIKIENDENIFIPLSELKNIRREIIEELENKILSSKKRVANIKKIEKFNEKEHKKLKIAVLVSNDKQYNIAKKYLENKKIDKIYFKQIEIANEKHINKIDLYSELCTNFYQLINNKNNKITLDKNFNIMNSYAIKELEKIDKIETIYLSQELDKENIKNIKSEKINKAMVIYGYLKGMYIEYPVFKDKKIEFKNDNGDEFIGIKNEIGNVEIYLKEPLNLIPKLDEIKNLNLDEVRVDFIFETEDEMIKILDSIENMSGEYRGYNFDTGVL
ncbi:MAG: family peptidase [Fusobacteriaceae bacterium]|jgi:putative protease|nr:peptidase [Fusobacteriales bacterium]MDN5304340.1 family peptidase [Fusobacteriaceae bacterium]